MAKTRVIKATNKCGKRVKISRVEKDMTQLDLATALNMDYDVEISSTGVSDLENGKRFVKDFEIIALADVLASTRCGYCSVKRCHRNIKANVNRNPSALKTSSKGGCAEVLQWQRFLPVQPFIERKFTSLGLHFSRILLENANHSGTLENGYLICISTGAAGRLTRKTEYGLEVGQLSPGDIIITPPCQELTWEITGKGEFTCVYASICYIEQVAASLGTALTEPTVIKGKFLHKDRLIEGLFAAIIAQIETTDYRDHIYTEAMARAMCVHLLHENIKPDPKPWGGHQRTFSYEQMERVRVYITEHLEERILSPDLARCVHVSDYHFFRIFKRTTGMTPQQFIKNIRLEKARFMLEHTQFSLYEIAWKTGFSDQSHFSREFRSLYGVSPRLLRDRMNYDRNLSLAF